MRAYGWLHLCVFSLLSSSAVAADWPTRPVRLISPFAVGGAADTVSHLVANALSLSLGQPFQVENRPGGGGLLASQYVAHAAPDGYTLIVGGMSSHVIAAAVSGKPGFDAVRDFTHMAYIGGAPTILLANPAVGVRTLKELEALAGRARDRIEYVTAGTGTVGNLVTEYIAAKDHIKLAHVPYKAGSAAVADLVAGRVQFGSLNWTTAREHIVFSRRLIPLASSSARRLEGIPDVPTLQELGYDDLVITTWYTVSGPAHLPQEIVDTVNREVIKSFDRPELHRYLVNAGAQTPHYTPAELSRYMQAEVEHWGPIVRATLKSE